MRGFGLGLGLGLGGECGLVLKIESIVEVMFQIKTLQKHEISRFQGFEGLRSCFR